MLLQILSTCDPSPLEAAPGTVRAEGPPTFGQARLAQDRGEDIVWLTWKPSPRPCFNRALLTELQAANDYLERAEGALPHPWGRQAFRYVALTSDEPGIFSLGGDLELFANLIERGDAHGLLDYGRASIDILQFFHRRHADFTILALVQGECMGGGFEGALAAEVLIAEQRSRFWFPEIHFNLFPGHGAYSLLARKVGPQVAMELVTSGRRYTAEELHRLGVVDRVVEDGQGREAVAAFTRERRDRASALAALAAVRHRVGPLAYSELSDVLEIWVDAALRLTPRDLKLIRRLVARQDRLSTRN